MNKGIIAGLVVAGLVAMPTASYAQSVEFTLDNKSSHNILYIYLSDPAAADWGDDILGEGYLFPAGTTGKVTINDAGDRCEFDVQFILDSKQVIEESGLNVCGGVTYTLSDTK
jgi:hypothetical protein